MTISPSLTLQSLDVQLNNPSQQIILGNASPAGTVITTTGAAGQVYEGRINVVGAAKLDSQAALSLGAITGPGDLTLTTPLGTTFNCRPSPSAPLLRKPAPSPSRRPSRRSQPTRPKPTAGR